MVRGGSWDYHAWYSRSAFRDQYLPEDRGRNFGFRAARTVGNRADVALQVVPTSAKLPLPAESKPSSPSPTSALTIETNTIGMKMALIPAGEFDMGSPDSAEGSNDEHPRHHVRITKPFWLGVNKVTVAQYRKFVEASAYDARGGWKTAFPSQTDDHPVVSVNWDDASAFCKWLNGKEGRRNTACRPRRSGSMRAGRVARRSIISATARRSWATTPGTMRTQEVRRIR